MSEIVFTATVYKVQTLAGEMGVRVTLDLPEDAIPQMAMLAETKREGIPLVFRASVAEDEPQLRRNDGDDRPRRKR